MKALAIDSAISKLTIASKNDTHTVTVIFDIGMKQSETLVPAIEYVLSKNGLTTKDLDYLTLSSGPGSFTGLRLAYSALKAIEMDINKPLYGISTLDIYEKDYLSLPFIIVCAIDAKKDRFYTKISDSSSIILQEGDWNIEQIVQALINQNSKKEILICGSDSKLLKEQIEDKIIDRKIFAVPFNSTITNCLFEETEERINKNEPPLKDFDGPIYLRASEAEIKLNS